ncbi:hypothetical protein [Microbacterium sp. 4-7]|uniref:hypothetical protein n=1 Tax=Microbacterium sp. 4-7 TaxID=1885327 RepID=UPI00164F69D0|nr:hypothetical protein [Microbacterium sp. 4-7]
MKGTRPRRKWWIVAGAIALAGALIVGGWAVALTFVSPQQVEAAAAPPSQAPLLATIERGDLIETQTWPASVAFAGRQSIPLAGPAETARSVVTKAPVTPGGQVDRGAVILEVNGNPVFIFESAFPFYRDLGLGDKGPDVLAFQSGLVGLGLLGEADGTFGAQTATATKALYTRAGYTALTRAPAEASADAATTKTADEKPTETSSPAPSVYIPLAALAASTSLPATVRSTPELGAFISDDSALTTDSSATEIRVALDSPEDLPAGSVVTVAVEGGESMPATVTSVEVATQAPGPDTQQNADNVAPTYFAVVLPADGSAVNDELVGRPASVSLQKEPLARDALLVPLSAVSVETDGTGTLMVEDAEGDFARVRVDIIAVQDGLAAISTDEAGVAEGRRVLLG